MRRKEREITELAEVEKILKKGTILHLAFNSGVYPYMLTVNYGYYMKNGTLELYFHGSKEGEKHKVIANDAHTTFEIECETAFMQPIGDVTCTASFTYESIIGHGITEAVPEEEKEQYLTDLMHHFGIENVSFDPADFSNTGMYRVRVNDFTAKRKENAKALDT